MRNTINVAHRFTCGLIVLTLVLAIAGLGQEISDALKFTLPDWPLDSN
jgi:hypothetical protein